MRKIIAIVVALSAAFCIWGVVTYNRFVKAQEEMQTAWAQVENVYQRRADLVPNLVTAVKSYAAHEQEVFETVAKARSKAIAIQLETGTMTDAQLADFQNVQDVLGESIGQLTAVAEDYPDLKANENYLTLHAQLEGCENRIQIERNRFNEMVQRYNKAVRRFPGNVVARLFGFKRQPYFKTLTENAEQAPKL